MEDSWQELIGFEINSREGPSSPVFHQKKWIVLSKPLKRSGSLPFFNTPNENFNQDESNERSKKLTIENEAQVGNNTFNGENSCKSDTEEDGLLIYNTTPSKKRKHKRKVIDLLSCSFRSEDRTYKKSKIDKRSEKCISHLDLSLSNIGEEKFNEYNLVKTLPSTSMQSSLASLKDKPTHQAKTNVMNPERKLLYSNNKFSTLDSKAQKLTVNDVYRSVIIIEEADIHPSSDKVKKFPFGSDSNDFQTVTLLSKNSQITNNVVVENGDDSFRNCMFTEIEKEYEAGKSGSLVSNDKIGPFIEIVNHADGKLMSDSYSNCQFRETGDDIGLRHELKISDNGVNVVVSSIKSRAESNSPSMKSCSVVHEALQENHSKFLTVTEESKSKCNEIFQGKNENLLSPESKNHSKVNLSNQKLTANMFHMDNRISAEKVDNIDSLKPISYVSCDTGVISEMEKIKPVDIQNFIVNPLPYIDISTSSPPNHEENVNPPHFDKNLNTHHDNIVNNPETKESTSNVVKSLTNENKSVSLQHNIQDTPYSIPNNDEKDLFDSTILTPKQSVLETETFKDTEHYFSTSKECFIDLDSVSTEEFRSASSKNIKKSILMNNNLSRCLQEEVINKSSSNRLPHNTTLTDIMQQLVKRTGCNRENLNSKHQKKNISVYDDRISENFTKSSGTSKVMVNEQHQISNMHSQSHSALLQTSPGTSPSSVTHDETVDSFQNYLPAVESQVDDSMSVLYYEQSFDNMISAEIKSRSSVNCCEISSQDRESTQLERFLSTEVSMVNDNISLSDNYLRNINFPTSSNEENNLPDLRADANEIKSHFTRKATNLSQYLKNINVNTDKSDEYSNAPPKNVNTSEKCLQNLFPINANSSKKNEECETVCGNIEISSEATPKEFNVNNMFLEQTFSGNDELNISGDKDLFISQDCLQQFNSSFSNSKMFSNDDDKAVCKLPRNICSNEKISILSLPCGSRNKEKFETVDTKFPNIFKKPMSIVSSQKSQMFSTVIEENVTLLKETFEKKQSVLNDDSECNVSHVDNIWHSWNGSNTVNKNSVESLNFTSSDASSDHCSYKIKSTVSVTDNVLNKVTSTFNVFEQSPPQVVMIDLQKDADHNPKNPLQTLSRSDMFEFSTAGGKDVKVNKDALTKVKSNFNEFLEQSPPQLDMLDPQKDIDQNSKNPSQISSRAGTFAFSTAGGKDVRVNKDALAKVQSKLIELLEQTPPQLVMIDPQKDADQNSKDSLQTLSQSGMFTFSTAGGKDVKVDKDSLTTVKSKFNELLEQSPPQLDMIDSQNDTDQNSKNPLQFSSQADTFAFSTAGGKDVKVNEDALAKVKSNFNEFLEQSPPQLDMIDPQKDTDQNSFKDCKDPLQTLSRADIFAFSTAGGKDVKVNKDSFANVKTKFNEFLKQSPSQLDMIDLKNDTDQNSKHPLQTLSRSDMFTFSTAGGKDVKVNKDSLATVKSNFNEFLDLSPPQLDMIDPQKDTDQNSKDPLQTLSRADTFAFSTAGGKDVKVNKDALAKVKSNFNEFLEQSLPQLDVIDLQNDTDQNPKDPLQPLSRADTFAFSTAGGKDVKVNKDSLAKVKSTFNEFLKQSSPHLDMIDLKNDTDQNSRHPLQTLSRSDMFTFSTAGGKDAKVNKDSLAKVKSTFNEFLKQSSPHLDMIDLKNDTDQNSKHPLQTLSRSDMFTFSTAGGKNVNEDALAKVKSNFNKFLELSPPQLDMIDPQKVADQNSKDPLQTLSRNDQFSFSTACGTDVKVNMDALSEVKLKFNELLELSPLEMEVKSSKIEIELSPENILKSSILANTIMCSTVGGKNVNFSEDDLAKVKVKCNDLLQYSLPQIEVKDMKLNIETSPEKILKRSSKDNPIMFSTAGGKNVDVSEDVLSKVKSKFSECLEHSPPYVEVTDPPILFDQLPKNPLRYSIGADIFTLPMARVKNVNVCEDSLSGGKSKFSELLSPEPKLVNISHSDYILLADNPSKLKTSLEFSCSSDKNVTVTDYVVSDKKSEFHDVLKNDHILGGFKFSTADNKDVSVSNDSFSKADYKTVFEVMDDLKPKIYFNSGDKIIKKSKAPHSESINVQEPVKKKICLPPEISVLSLKTLEDEIEQDKKTGSRSGHFTFTQSVPSSVLNEEMDLIEKTTIPIKNIVEKKSYEKMGLLKDIECEKSKGINEFETQESELSMICEVSDSAAAFMADCTPGKSILTSPSSFFNRKKLKPINLLSIEFDEIDDDIMVAAELKIIPISVENNSVRTDSKKPCLDIVNFRTCSTEIVSIRNSQRGKVDKIIIDKLNNSVSISPGLYMTLRNEGKLVNIINSPLCNPQSNLTKDLLLHHGVMEEVINMSSTNAIDHKFFAEHFFSYEECLLQEGKIDLGNDFSLILSDDNKIGLDEITRSFLSHKSVDPSLVAPGWIRNHFRWIVWKLACYERAFPQFLSRRNLTPQNVLHQLKYRYDREIDLAQRSAFKRILECDEPSSRRLIACVSDIRKVDLDGGESSFEMELTDSWYSVWASVDPAMVNVIKKEKVKVGTKLIFQAAELLNCTDGCDPLQLPDSVRLKLHSNCTRRAKWNAKMGFTRFPGPLCVSLNSILPNGGIVGHTSAIIVRVYPLLFMSKDTDGKTVFMNSQAENHANNLKQNELFVKSEELFEKFLPEVESKYKTRINDKFDRNNIKHIKDPKVLWKIISNESDPSDIQSSMTSDQLLEVQKYHEVISSKIREEVQALVKVKLEKLLPSQKTKCLLKLRLVDPLTDFTVLLTVWNPSEDLCQQLSEKKCFDFYGLMSSGTRDKVLQLSSTSRTIYKENKIFKPNQKYERIISSISDIVASSMPAHFGELDVVGVVILVKEPEKPWGVTNVYLSDDQDNFLVIMFWTSLKTFGCEEALKHGCTVACINLQWRQGSGSYVIPSTYANEVTCFSTNPNQEYLSRELQNLKTSISSKESFDNFIMQRRKRLLNLLKEKEYNPRILQVGRVETPKVLKRLENLKKYGEASPLPNVSLMSSPDIYRKFRSPKTGSS